MKIERLDGMTKGWFIGAFEPTLCKTSDFEVAVKKYKMGDREEAHHHKIATEYTVILDGRACMGGHYMDDGDICVVEPGESVDFFAVTDVTTVVVKTPSVSGDKYPG